MFKLPALGTSEKHLAREKNQLAARQLDPDNLRNLQRNIRGQLKRLRQSTGTFRRSLEAGIGGSPAFDREGLEARIEVERSTKKVSWFESILGSSRR